MFSVFFYAQMRPSEELPPPEIGLEIHPVYRQRRQLLNPAAGFRRPVAEAPDHPKSANPASNAIPPERSL